MNRKQWLLGLALLLTLIATGYVYQQDKNADGAVPDAMQVYPHAKPQPPAVSVDEQPHAIGRELFVATTDIFQAIAAPAKPEPAKPEIKPPPVLVVAPVVVLPPAPPAAPPLPFRFIGKLYADGEYMVFLGWQGKNLMVRLGDEIQKTYHVDEIKPPVMKLTYLPMNIQQNFLIGEPN